METEPKFDYIEYRKQLATKVLNEPNHIKRREILGQAKESRNYKAAEALHQRAILEAEVKFSDELVYDKELNREVKIRKLEYPPRVEKILQEGAKNPEETELINRFLFVVSEGRYPSYFTFNHVSGAFSKEVAEPQDKIKGWVSVCSVGNIFLDDLLSISAEQRKSSVDQGAGKLRLFILGSKNPTFRNFLKEVRAKAEEKEGQKYFENLPPLEIPAEEMAKYVDSNPDAQVKYGRAQDRQRAIALYGSDIVFTPPIPFFGLTQINHSGDREGLEFLSILYSNLAFRGHGDFGGRIMINSETEKGTEKTEVYKNFDYKWGELSEMMIDLDEKKVVFFSPERQNSETTEQQK
jgi:hypothetical protein